ncbi:MAG: zinc dependent phospholipase C family protein [Cyanobacteriota bacterium]
MPGAYAHITLVNLLRDTRRLERIPGLPTEAIPAVLDYLKFCELGSVSPDYPYLSIGDTDAKKWADQMHKHKSGDMLKSGVKNLMEFSGEAKRKGLAWLMGYAAHVVADVTVHPVIEMKVGEYESNKRPHRVCELNQDAYIFPRLNLGGIGLSEYLKSGISKCCNTNNSRKLDKDIRELWISMLRDTYPEEFKTNPPKINKWHSVFKWVVDKVVEEGNRLFPFARHLAVRLWPHIPPHTTRLTGSSSTSSKPRKAETTTTQSSTEQ